MKKAITFILAAALSISAMAGCSSSKSESSEAKNSSEASSSKSERSNITVLLRGNESSTAYKIWSTLLDDYKKEKGLDLNVEYEMVPNDGDYANKLQLYIASNQLPDIFGCANGTFSSAAKDIGSLVNLQDEMEKIGKFDSLNKAVADFLADADDGKMWLFPESLNCEFFFYRKDKFDEYGLTAPKTWDEFINVCKVLKEKEEIPVVIAGAEQWQIMRYLSYMPWRVTHDKFIKGFIDQTDSFAQNDVAKKAVNLVSTMGQNGYFQSGFTSTNYTDATNMFFGGKGCIFYSGSHHITNASLMYKSGQLGFFPVPDADGEENMTTNLPVHGGFATAFNAQTYDSTMQDFFAYVCDHYGDLCYANGVFSPFKGNLPDGLDQMFYDLQPVIESATEGWVSWDDKLDSATLSEMADAQQELALNMITPDEFISQMDEAVVKNNTKG